MRSETPTPAAHAASRLRAEYARARRRFAARPPAVRWSAGVAAVAAAVALAYAGAGPATPPGGFVRSGERFGADDRVTLTRELDAKHIRYRVDRLGRVEVAAAKLDEADEVAAKLDVGFRPLQAIDRRAAESSVWDTPAAREQRREEAANERLAAMIRPIDGVVSAWVRVNRPRPRGYARSAPEAGATAFVWLETEDNREASSETVGKVQTLVAGAEPAVRPDDVTVFDRKGRQYLNPRDPSVGTETRHRALADHYRQEILKALQELKGVEVSVRVDPAAVAPPPAEPPAAAPAAEPALPPLSVGVNRPLELAPAPRPRAAPAPAPAAAPEPSGRARVWVKVPRSFYLKAASGRGSSLDDLQPLVERTRALVETAVRHVVPPGRLDTLEVSTVPDELPARDAAPPPGAAQARRSPAWWLPAAAGGGAAAGLAAVAFGVLAARRPSPGPAPPPADDHVRYDVPGDGAGPGPGPSERVRELIRLNPEAAASVLHRWTGQGGPIG